MLLFAHRNPVQGMSAPDHRANSAQRLRAVAVLLLALTTGMPASWAQAAPAQDSTLAELPAAPAPKPTEPLFLRQSATDYSIPRGRMLDNPIRKYTPTVVPKASFYNSVRLTDLVKGGKIYLSLSDALALALENNYDIAIARYNLDIADTDILRSKAGASLMGVNAGLVSGTLGSASSTLTSGGGPGGTTVSAGSSGTSGLSMTTNGAGPAPAALDPILTSTIQLARTKAPVTSSFSASNTNTDSYNFAYAQGFTPGTLLNVAFNNSRVTSNSIISPYSPQLISNFKATVTQHLLQGAGMGINKRFMYQALNNRRYTDASFRLQLLYTVNQVENIYWALVGAYENVQAKEQALEQSTRLAADNRKQLEIGSMAPLDVVNSDSAVATDRQALITAQSSLTYQQLIMKQAIARNLSDAALMAAPVVPTDRITLEQLPEEKLTPDELAEQAFKNRPELEQAVLTLKNNEITLKGAKNALLPVLDLYAYYGASSQGGAINAHCYDFKTGGACNPASYPTIGYGTVVNNLFNSTAPDKGVGFSLNVPLRNRTAQSVQARSQLEYRQAQLRIEQIYTQIRMQVVNAQYALTNDRALVESAVAAENYNRQSLDAEEKKLKLGASTTANVLMQERNLATATYNLISARASYARDRANLYQTLASTLEHYGINLSDAASGEVKETPAIPGLVPAKK